MQLRALAVLLEDLGSIRSINMTAHNNYKSGFRVSDTFLRPRLSCRTQSYMQVKYSYT